MVSLDSSADSLFLGFQLAVAGRYSIDRELGRGGMGVVYLAREVHLDRLVAIKLLPPDRASEPALRDRFLREARLAAKLSHPNIIPIHSVEDTNGFVFYVMAFVDGVTLAQRVRTRGPLGASEGARVLREVAWALAYAHAQGLVHRDVKPDNILLESATGRVLVADFGIAAALGDAAADKVSGTPEFISPEQALGKTVDARSDLYSLGATAFYAFSGRFPFEGKTVTEILAKQVTETAPPLLSLGMALPRRLAALVDRCLSKEPELRPESAQALAEQLGVALEQRRELPVALRAFVKRSGRLDGGGTLIATFGLMVGSIIISAIYGAQAGFSALFLGATALPFAYLVNAARRLTLMGFTHQDIGPAFKTELDQAREELSVDHRSPPSFIEKLLPSVIRISGTFAALSVAGLVLSAFTGWWGLGPIWGVVFPASWATFTLTGIAHLAFAQRRRDVDTELWSRLWLGKIGKAAFRVAKKLLGSRARESAVTHRATELSLGLAAEQLYETLPKQTRRDLGDLPSLLQRLQDDAQLLRRRYNELQEVLGDANDASSDAYTDVRAARDAVHAKLGEAVGALEMIRLNLLRLHAGSETVAGFTTNIAFAADVSDEVQRLVAAQEETERAMRFPRHASPTPV